MIKRALLDTLQAWKGRSSHKPIVLRGARQVGKSHLVRDFGKGFGTLAELNFEERPEAKRFFNQDLSPDTLLLNLQAFLATRISPGETLLFLDEVQECPQAVTALRYFYEKLPALHIVAAGSLLDFELDKIGVPVGRVDFLHLFPVSFYEFLQASGAQLLLEELERCRPNRPVSEAAHLRLLEAIRIYSFIGGMPEVMTLYLEMKDLRECQAVQTQIINTYRQDFNKYAKNRRIEHVRTVFDALPRQLGNKLKYSNIERDVRSLYLSDALNLLAKAHVAHKIHHSSGNGVPLAAEINPRDFKCACVDIGLALRALSLDYASVAQSGKLELVNNGAIAEQFVAQEFLAYANPTEEPSLFYWRRESKSGNAEVDYLLAHKDLVIPVEVKSGASGRLKSLQVFLQEKKASPFGMRIYSGPFKDERKTQRLLHVPLYALHRLDREILK